MQYEGKLYGKVAGKYIELGTTEEYESWNLILQKRIEELEDKLDYANMGIEEWRSSYFQSKKDSDKRIAELEDGLQEIIDHAYENGSHARTMRKIAIGTLRGRRG